MKNRLLIYGCYGYTGALISRLAVEKGLQPILAGRNAQQVQTLADSLHAEWRAFDLDHAQTLDEGMRDIHTVLHCAGPFMYTSKKMIEACLRNQVHYLDITGEIGVFERAHHRHAAAVEADILVMPGVGFDVVPTDCLSLYLKNQLPEASQLELCLMTVGGQLSHGTAITMVESMDQGSAIRKNGVLTPTRMGATTRDIDFGFTQRTAVEIPWGDVSTAYYTTGIPNIRVYNALPKSMIQQMKRLHYIAPLLRWRWVKNFLIRKIKQRPAGPNEQERGAAQSYVWGEVSNGKGIMRRAMLRLPEGYALTVLTAVEIATHVLGGKVKARGYHTPASIFGADFILQFDNTERTDLT